MDIIPIKKEERNFNGIDYFLFWTGVAISLAEIWAGAFLAPLGLLVGIIVILLGHMIGNTFLGLGGIIGSDYGISSMVSVRPSFGIKGANIASLFNIIQLIGWAAILLIIAANAGAILGKFYGGLLGSYKLWAVIIGLLTLIWALYTGKTVWKYMQILACFVMMYVIVVMTYMTFKNVDISNFTFHSGSKLHFMTALDLVIAMPISFLPIVADYSRFAKSTKRAFTSTWLGYFIISAWMYILGLGGVILLGEQDPTRLILKSFAIIGLAIPALCMVIFSTVTSNFPDLYSATCSMKSMSNKINDKLLMTVFAVLIILIALIFPMDQYENYLFIIGAMFIPLFGVVLTDYFIIRKRKLNINNIDKKNGEYWYSKGYNLIAIISWLIGFCLYLMIKDCYIGGSIPSIVTAGVIYYFLTKAKWSGRIAGIK
ncbi:MAG TPA: putative hydroxymethylpyrimidine transporter CytX [Victivallales bacterium]|nr:putative hydroxymethylpyrimidine transporter CytX [Victivallales bacterium]